MNVAEYIASGVLEAVVLGTATEQEQREVQCLSSIYPEIAEALAELREGLEGLAEATATPPPPELKGNILAAIKNEQQEGLLVAVASDDEDGPNEVDPGPGLMREKAEGKRVHTGWWAAAASVAMLAMLGWMYFTQQSDLQATQDQLAQQAGSIEALEAKQLECAADAQAAQDKTDALQGQLAIVTNPGTQQVVLAGTDNLPEGQALVYWNSSNTKAYLDASGLPTPEAGKQYQLWAIVDGQPTDMGVFDLDAAAAALVEMTSVENPQAFAITLEVEGGQPTPNLAALVVIGNV